MSSLPKSNYTLREICYESIHQSTAIFACAVVIIVYIVLSALRELLQVYQQRLRYICEIVNLISWILYVSTLIMVLPVFKFDGGITNVHYSAASISVFLSWFRLLLFLQRFDQVRNFAQKLLPQIKKLLKYILYIYWILFKYDSKIKLFFFVSNLYSRLEYMWLCFWKFYKL